MSSRLCLECRKPITTRTADRCLDCFRVWQSGPTPNPPDWVIVERLMDGQTVPEATRPERHEAIKRLDGKGYGPREIADRLNRPERSISRLTSAWRDRQPAQ